MPPKNYKKPDFEYYEMKFENGKTYDICKCNEEGYEGTFIAERE